MTAINLRFSTLDGIRKTKAFKTLKGARKAAHDWIGADADIGGHYAVSTDGIVKLTVEGCTLADIFGAEPARFASEGGDLDDWFKVRVGGSLVAETFQYRQDAEAYCHDHDDFTYEDDSGAVRVMKVDVEHYRAGTDGKPELIPPPPPVQRDVRDDEIPF